MRELRMRSGMRTAAWLRERRMRRSPSHPTMTGAEFWFPVRTDLDDARFALADEPEPVELARNELSRGTAILSSDNAAVASAH